METQSQLVSVEFCKDPWTSAFYGTGSCKLVQKQVYYVVQMLNYYCINDEDSNDNTFLNINN